MGVSLPLVFSSWAIVSAVYSMDGSSGTITVSGSLGVRALLVAIILMVSSACELAVVT